MKDAEAAPPVTAEVTRPAANDFEAFYVSEHARLFGVMCLVTRNTAEAEELMQEAFLKVWERWDRVQDHPDRAAYLFRTAFNLNRNRVRRAMIAARRLVRPTAPDDVYAAVLERESLLRGLRRLTPRQRVAVVLIDLLDMSSGEAGDLLGVRPSTARALASQARASLRTNLENSYE